MRGKILLGVFGALFLVSCSSSRKAATVSSGANSVKVTLDLVNVLDDKVKVTVIPPAITAASINFNFAKTIPGTYAVESYGRYIEDLKAISKAGTMLTATKKGDNTWEISDANQLASVTYLVNDTYDNEGEAVFAEGSTTIFSPAGTNILAGKNFVLNMCGFAGYFDGFEQTPYDINIKHPENLRGVTSLDDLNASNTEDKFKTKNYAEMVDCPIMYAPPDISEFKIGTMDVILSVYSPANKKITAKVLSPGLEKMMQAQKNFLGPINNTKKYAILSYLTTDANDDAKGIGALEHNFSTTAVFRKNMTNEELYHVISHEFFHTLTPLNVHSKEIQYFNFSAPVMSQHLWMYEGFTEYFANFFQVNQGLISEDEFLALMTEKISNSRNLYDDKQSFTIMSKNVLDEKMKSQYPNVYEKGALMAMCLDILIRKNSGGSRSLKSMMGELSKIYGPEKPFDDDELIPQIVKITYPEVGEFIEQYVVKGSPIDYNKYFGIVGLTPIKLPIPGKIVFIVGRQPYVGLDTTIKKAFAVIPDDKNKFMNALGIQNRDIFLEMNGEPFDASNVNAVFYMGLGLKEGDPITMKVQRKGQVVELKGKVALNYEEGEGYKFTDQSKKTLHDAWLKGQ